MCPILILIITVLFLVRFPGTSICKWLFYGFFCLAHFNSDSFFFILFRDSSQVMFLVGISSVKTLVEAEGGNVVCSLDKTRFKWIEHFTMDQKWDIFFFRDYSRAFDVQASDDLAETLSQTAWERYSNDLYYILVVYLGVRHLSYDDISFQLRCRADSRSVYVINALYSSWTHCTRILAPAEKPRNPHTHTHTHTSGEGGWKRSISMAPADTYDNQWAIRKCLNF